MKHKNSRECGMSLVELMTTVVMVAILASIAYPNYSQYQQRARRMDAKAALQQIAINQEQFYVTNRTYTNNLVQLGYPGGETEAGFYVINMPAADDQGFQAVVVPAPGSPQAADSDCQQFTIDDQSTRGAVPDPDGKCW